MWITLGFAAVGVSAFSGIIIYDIDGPVTIELGGLAVLASLFMGTVIQGSGKGY